jgi:hypothetical protein
VHQSYNVLKPACLGSGWYLGERELQRRLAVTVPKGPASSKQKPKTRKLKTKTTKKLVRKPLMVSGFEEGENK